MSDQGRPLGTLKLCMSMEGPKRMYDFLMQLVMRILCGGIQVNIVVFQFSVSIWHKERQTIS